MLVNRNLYSKDLKRNKKNLAIWSTIVLGFTMLVLSIFPYMQNMGDQMAVMMSKMPEGMTKAMGIDKDTFNSILGMYNTYYGIYIVVLLSIYTASTAATIISKEEKYKTAEFLLTRPVSRKSVFCSKLLVLFTVLIISYLVQTIIAVIFVKALGGEQVRWSVFITMHTHGLILIFFFTCVGLFLSMLMRPRKNFMGMIVGIVFGSYFLSTLAKAADIIHWIGYVSPFHYLDFSVSNPNYNINFPMSAIMVCVGVLLMFLSYKVYDKKDIST